MKRRTKPEDYIGRRFGRLTIVSIGPKKGAHGYIVGCQCKCGNWCEKKIYDLTGGTTKSCGCLAAESRSKPRTHGKTGTVEYKIWAKIKLRTENPNTRSYRNYGARGIKLCSLWRQSFDEFLAHVGLRPSPSHSIDRIDNDRGYEPGNVRWATREQQASNRRNTVMLTFNGVSKPQSVWEKETGVRVGSRLKMGWSVEDAITRPKGTGGRRTREERVARTLASA